MFPCIGYCYGYFFVLSHTQNICVFCLRSWDVIAVKFVKLEDEIHSNNFA